MSKGSRKRREENRLRLKPGDDAAELKLIEDLRRLVADESKVESLKEWAKGFVYSKWGLELSGTNLEAQAELREQAGYLPDMKYRMGKDSQEWHTLAVAAMIRCLVNACPHAMSVSTILYIFMAARLTSCKSCLPEFFDRLAEYGKGPAHRQDQCDLCLCHGVKTFRKSTCAYQGKIMFGDFCETCHQLTKGEKERP